MPYTYSTRRFFLLIFCFLFLKLPFLFGQDTLKELTLDAVVVKAFEQNRNLKNIPAAVNYIENAVLHRFSPVSIVSAVNTTPGVRMEERSPGSYRVNIRGSALRSPFGVRNVKVYFNDIPFTDPGGNTYVNQLGFYDYHSLEIIKGPGSSLYGAGTGGALLIESLDRDMPLGATLDYTTGSFGLHSLYGSLLTGNENSKNRIAYQHLQSDGYRNHSRLRKDVLSWNGLYRWDNGSELRTTFLAGDLFYQTPGALNAAEYAADRKRARPAAGIFPGAEQARASINQKTIIAGASYTQPIGKQLKNKTVVYAAFTQMNNPAIRNYGRNKEPHGGARTVFTWTKNVRQAQLSVFAGAELQRGLASFSIHRNFAGMPDTLQTFDEVDHQQGFVFTNIVLDVKQWTFTGGSSLNGSRIRFHHFFPAPVQLQNKQFSGVWAPRFSVMHRFTHFNIYASVAEGFSPPSTTEILPTGSPLNLELVAEKGTNYDLGVRSTINDLFVDVNVFIFSLNNTIVQRRTAGGGEYFINAGSTRQSGLEASLRYPVFKAAVDKQGMIWASYTGHHFRYREFGQLDNDFSGKKMPGIAPHTVSTGMDVSLKSFLATGSYFFSSRMPLNDANDAFANAYHLVAAKLGYEIKMDAFMIRASIGADNVLDQDYSLGNDINGPAGRYYNAAPGRNYFVSLVVQRRSL